MTKLQDIPLDSIVPAPWNPRAISVEAMKGLGESLTRYGLLGTPVVVVHGDRFRLVGGHQRIEILRKRGDDSVTCIVADLSEEDAKLANIALNHRALRGRPQVDAVILTKLAGQKIEVAQFDRFLTELRRKLPSIDVPKEAAPSPGVTRKRAVVGKLYAKDAHRIVCGHPLDHQPWPTADLFCAVLDDRRDKRAPKLLAQCVEDIGSGVFFAPWSMYLALTNRLPRATRTLLCPVLGLFGLVFISTLPDRASSNVLATPRVKGVVPARFFLELFRDWGAGKRILAPYAGGTDILGACTKLKSVCYAYEADQTLAAALR